MQNQINKTRLTKHCMKEYQWSEDKASKEVLRYEKLFKLFGKGTIVPTKELDKVWHCHMLDPIAYYNDCIAYHNKLIGHNPSLEMSEGEKERLNFYFNQTKQLWQEEYNEEYSGMKAECDGPDHTCLECSTGGWIKQENYNVETV